MLKKWLAYTQHVLPQHLISNFFGYFAESKTPWLKNWMIDRFSKTYQIDLNEAIEKNPHGFPTFNDFFIRQLMPSARPLSTSEIVSPADGKIAQIGAINKNLLLQVKQFYFDLAHFIGDKQQAQSFYDGAFATIYLAPNNYHRIHMPISGTLKQTIYIPGSLFSVNQMTTDIIPNLYSRNERLVCLFDTSCGPMAVVLVGALIVGSIQAVWMDKPLRGNQVINQLTDPIRLEKGAELGCFKLGSTVVVLFGKEAIRWNGALSAGSCVKFGQELADLIK